METTVAKICTEGVSFNFNLNPGQPRTLLQLKLVGILTINLFLT
jgi:hypothetical protein